MSIISSIINLTFKHGNSWKRIGIAWVCYFMFVMVMMVFTPSQANIAKQKIGYEIPDLSIGINESQLYSILEIYGSDGRYKYKLLEYFDFFPYMFGYTISLMLTTAKSLINRGYNASNSKWSYLVLLPLLVQLCDIIENIAMLFILDSFPSKNHNYFTIFTVAMHSKWVLFIINLTIVAINFIMGQFKSTAKPKST